MIVEVHNSVSRVTGITPQQFRELAKILSYRVSPSEAYYSKAKSPIRCLLGKRGDFPTGLLYLVEEWGDKVYRGWVIKDRRIRPDKVFEIKPVWACEAYPEQLAAVAAAKEHERGIICAPTGVGKSRIAAELVNAFRVSTLIVVPGLELKHQLTQSFLKWFGPTPLVTIENVDALDPKKELKGIDMVIIDEFHHAGAKTYRQLNKKVWKNVYYKFGLTATPFRSNSHERLLLESVLSKVIYAIPYEDSVAKNRIVPLEAYYYDLPIQDMEGNESHWGSVYSELVVNNKVRNALITQLLCRLQSQGRSTLCLVKEIRHGELLSQATGLPFANGEADDCTHLIESFSSGQLNGLIATTGVAGEGRDTRAAEFVILAAGGKSKNSFMQSVGRAFRTYPGKESAKIVMFRDKSHKYLHKHFNACVRHLRDEYGVKPVQLTTD